MSIIRKLQNAFRTSSLTPEKVVAEIKYRCSLDYQDIEKSSAISTNSITQISNTSYECDGFRSNLSGIPFTVKDNFCVDSKCYMVPTTCASKTLLNFFPNYNASVVQSILDNGGMFIGKANMDEFAMGCGSTDNNTYGPVKNPWSPSKNDLRIAGGSSGGSAAAVAAGLGVFSIGSDTGGSVRLPAALCGVVGYKPSYGLLSRHGLIPLCNMLDCPSLITTNVEDAQIVLSTWLNDPSARNGDTTLVEYNNIRCERFNHNLNVGIVKEFYVPGLSDEIADVWDSVMGYISDNLHFPVKMLSAPHLPLSLPVYVVLCCSDVASNMARYDGIEYGLRIADELKWDKDILDSDTTDGLYAINRRLSFGSIVKERILSGNYFLLRENRSKYLNHAKKYWNLIVDDFNNIFEQVDFLVAPVHLNTASNINEFMSFDNRARSSRDDVCTVPVNLAGLPAISIPICLGADSLPIGIQIIGNRGSDYQLLQFASQLENIIKFKPLVDIFDWFE